jgi:hypothetical protein
MATQPPDDSVRPSLHPSPFDFGITYQGAVLEGSFRVSPAKEIRRIHFSHPNGQELIEVRPRPESHRDGLICDFRVRTEEPRSFLVFVGIDTDMGSTCTHFSAEIRPGTPPGGRILFCASPFGAFSDDWTYRNLSLTLRELRAQANATDLLPHELSPFAVSVLHGGGLFHLVQEDRERLHAHLATGGRVVVFANYFFRKSVMLANHLIEPYGIRLEDREYREVLCERPHVTPHTLTAGVERLRWFRPSPLFCEGTARLLVRHPEQPSEGFVACSGPRDNLVVVGTSLLSSLLCEGWPSDNGRLFANLLGYLGG